MTVVQLEVLWMCGCCLVGWDSAQNIESPRRSHVALMQIGSTIKGDTENQTKPTNQLASCCLDVLSAAAAVGD